MSENDNGNGVSESFEERPQAVENLREQEKLRVKFDKEYRHVLETVLGKKGNSLLGKIAGKYEMQYGDLEKAIDLSVNELELSDKEKTELKELILEGLKMKDLGEKKEKSPLFGFSKNDIERALENGEASDALVEWADNELERVNNMPEETEKGPLAGISMATSWNRQADPAYKMLLVRFLTKFGGVESYRENQEMQEHPYFPIINRLKESRNIEPETYDELIQSFSKKGEFDFGSIKDAGDKKTLENIIKNNNPEENKRSFKKDYPELDRDIESGKLKGIELEVIMMVAENYVNIESGDKENDKIENYSTATKTVANKIINMSVNLDKDDVAYKEAMKLINSNNNKVQFIGLTKLYLLSGGQEGAFAKKAKGEIEQKERKKYEIIERIDMLIQKAIKNGDDRLARQMEARKVLMAMEQQERGNNPPEKGDVSSLSGGELDASPENPLDNTLLTGH